MKILTLILIKIIKTYQFLLSPLFGRSCRYLPTCSEYSIEALKVHGFFKGIYLSLKRILSCHPIKFLGGGEGFDPVNKKLKVKIMDTKNVIAAITLSSAIIILWSLFMIPDQPPKNQELSKKDKIEQNTDTPSLEQKETLVKISRDEALKQSERIKFENNNIIGSISLKGASIDDLTFKNYKLDLNEEEKVTLLGPRNIDQGYLIESGFVTTDKNIDIPNSETVWSIIGNNKLTDKTPIKLSWTNDQGITFEKQISLDDKYLFTINQKVINETEKKYDFYSYGQIIRNEIPEIIDFLILHEGLIATLDDELIEED